MHCVAANVDEDWEQSCGDTGESPVSPTKQRDYLEVGPKVMGG